MLDDRTHHPLPGLGLSSEGPDRLAVAMHFGRLEDRNAPRMGSRGHQPSHIQRHPCKEIHPCYPTTIGVSGDVGIGQSHPVRPTERITSEMP
jgi:hypothetical protein